MQKKLLFVLEEAPLHLFVFYHRRKAVKFSEDYMKSNILGSRTNRGQAEAKRGGIHRHRQRYRCSGRL